MWFKTRAGLFSVMEPMEIKVAEYPEAKKPYYLIYARPLTDASVDYKGIFGKLKVPGRYVHLAQSHLSAASLVEITRCMEIIERAIVNEVKLCDLSAAGHADVWTNWHVINW